MAKLKEESQNRVHLLKQTDPAVFPVAAAPQVMTSFALRRQAPDQARTKFRPMGYRARDWGALLRHFESFQGNVSLDYRQINVVLEMFLGAPAIDTTTAGIQRREYFLRQNELNDLVHYAIEYGKVGAAKRMLMSLLTTFSLTITKGNQPGIESQATILANKPLKDNAGSELFPMSGAVAQPSIFNVAFNAVTAARAVQFKNAAGVNLGAAISITPGMTAAALQTAIRALGAPYVAANVTGTTNSIAGGGDQSGTGFIAGGSASPAVTPTNLFDDNTATTSQFIPGNWAAWDRGVTPAAIDTFRVYPTSVGLTATLVFQAADDAAFTTGLVTLATWDQTIALNQWTAFAFAANTKRYVRVLHSGGANQMTLAEVEFYNAAAASTSTGAYAIDTLTNTLIALPSTADSGVVISYNQAGSNGTLGKPDPYPMLPQHFSVKRAGVLTNLTAALPMKRLHQASLNISNIVEPDQVIEEGNLGYSDYVGGDLQIAFRLTVIDDEEDANSEAASLRALSENSPATAEWFRVQGNHPDTKHKFYFEGKFAAGEAYSPSAGGRVYQYEYPMELELNGELSDPSGKRALMRFVTEVAV